MATETFIPLSLAEVTPDYLTTAFRDAGILRNGQVVGFDSRVIGEGAGFMGEVVDMHLTFSQGSEEAPPSVIMKIPTATKNRQIGQTLGVYEREILFYRELQPVLNIRTPRHVFSAMDLTTDPETGLKALKILDRMPIWVIKLLLPLMNWLNGKSEWHYVLMIEHLGGFRIGDQVAGCSPEESRRVLGVMAKLHAQFWQSEKLADFPWLVPIRYAAKPTQMMYLQAVAQFKQHHAASLSPHGIYILDWLRDHYFELMTVLTRRPATLIHGDFRLDNLCFDDATGEVVLFDWQTLGIGAGGIDLAYFLSAAVASDASDGAIDELLDVYREGLAAEGVLISSEELRWDYDASLLAMLHRIVPAQFQDMLELGEGRGSDLIGTWLERIFHHIERVDPDALMRTVPGD